MNRRPVTMADRIAANVLTALVVLLSALYLAINL